MARKSARSDASRYAIPTIGLPYRRLGERSPCRSSSLSTVDRRSPRLTSDQSGVSDLLEITVGRSPRCLWI